MELSELSRWFRGDIRHGGHGWYDPQNWDVSKSDCLGK